MNTSSSSNAQMFVRDAGPTRQNGHKYSDRKEELSYKQRLRHFTFAWFACTMSTGGIATLLNSQPHTFSGLRIIGKIVFIFDLIVLVCFTAAILARFTLYKGTFLKAISHPTEGLFIATFFLSIVDVLNAANAYGTVSTGAWLVYALKVCFWIYLALTFLLAVAQYSYLFSAPPKHLTIQSMTPSWLLPIFPAMLCGTMASVISPSQPATSAMTIIIAGVSMQGLGWLVSLLMYAVYIERLMQFGLPAPNLRPGMFIAVGPPSFTSLALIGMAKAAPENYGYFATHPGSILIVQTMALFSAIFIWSLGFWFFCQALVATLLGINRMRFHLVWYAFVFPNVGLTIALIDIGTQLESEAIQWVGSVMSCLVVAIWLFVMVTHARAVIRRKIMMPDMDEDKDQHKSDDDKKHTV